MKTAHYLSASLLATLLVSLSACNMLVYDDTSDCPTSADHLHFVYTADGKTDVFPRHIHGVQLFFFAADGSFVSDSQIKGSILEREQGTTIDLNDGTYTAVAWGNPFADTKMLDTQRLSTAYLLAPPALTQETVQTNDSLYFATRRLTYSHNRSERDTLIFRSAHVKVRLQLENPDRASGIVINPPQDPAFRINHLSRSVDFRGTPSQEQIDYYPTIRRSKSGDYESACNVLRFEDKNPITIDLIDRANGNHIVGSLRLEDFLAKHKIRISGINEATVAIKFTLSGTTVTIEPWGATNVNPGFDK